jgi:hypothetical protein
MHGDGFRHLFLLRDKPTFCVRTSVSRLLKPEKLTFRVGEITGMSDRPQKITFAEMRDMGVPAY